MIMATWVHTHLPRLRSGETPDVLSVKVPGQRVDYASWVFMSYADFRVHERGRQRCITDGVRNVHAWVVGMDAVVQHGTPWEPRPDAWRQAVYDPWKGSTFVDLETLQPVRQARYVIMSGKNVYYIPLGD